MLANALQKIIRPKMSIVTRLGNPGINKGREKGPQSQSTAGERSLHTVHHLNFLCPPTYKHTLISCFSSFHTPTLFMPTNCFLHLLPRIYDPSFIFYPKLEASATTSPSSSIICDSSARMKPQGFPGGAVVENLPANTGDTGSSPGLGRSHMPRSSWAHEPQLLSLSIWSLCSATGEAAIVRGPRTAMKSGPHSPQLERALAQKRRPNTAKNLKK